MRQPCTAIHLGGMTKATPRSVVPTLRESVKHIPRLNNKAGAADGHSVVKYSTGMAATCARGHASAARKDKEE